MRFFFAWCTASSETSGFHKCYYVTICTKMVTRFLVVYGVWFIDDNTSLEAFEPTFDIVTVHSENNQV